jgi:hypothetical protein
MILKLPECIVECCVSLPCFNVLHHVRPTSEGNLLVVNTGLDMVLEITRSGKVLREWGVLQQDPWSRFSREIDYRRVASTKPHESHANFVFQLGSDIWVTRFHQKDAVCLTQPGKRIQLGGESPHDGVLHAGMLYFTTVEGELIVVEPNTLKVAQRIDLSEIDRGDKGSAGFCRGVLLVDDGLVWVGFTRIRKSALMHGLVWAKYGFKNFEAPTHVALYDIRRQKLLREIDLEPCGVNILFGIHRFSG